MQEYTVTGPVVSIHGGRLGLTPSQASARAYALEKTEEADAYEVKSPVHFKNGETFQYEGPGLGRAAEACLDKKPPKGKGKESKPVSDPEPSLDLQTLAEKLGLKNKEAQELLLDYGFEAKKPTTPIPLDLTNQVIADFVNAPPEGDPNGQQEEV